MLKVILKLYTAQLGLVAGYGAASGLGAKEAIQAGGYVPVHGLTVVALAGMFSGFGVNSPHTSPVTVIGASGVGAYAGWKAGGFLFDNGPVLAEMAVGRA